MKRFIGGAIFVICVVSAILLRQIHYAFFDAFIWILMAIATYEMARAMRKYLKLPNYISVGVYVLATYPCFLIGGLSAIFILFLVYFWASMIICIYSDEHSLQNLARATLLGVYPVLMFTLFFEVNHWTDMGLIALSLSFAVGPLTDVFAYFVGKSVGGEKLMPEISPKKTIAGAIGGVFGGIIAALLVYVLFTYILKIPINTNNNLVFCLLFGIIGSILTEFGDLAESLIKRSLGIKDMGTIIIGHGGVLDRFDGILFVIFATYIYFQVILVFTI